LARQPEDWSESAEEVVHREYCYSEEEKVATARGLNGENFAKHVFPKRAAVVKETRTRTSPGVKGSEKEMLQVVPRDQ
jgi:hypothetical protein